MNMFPRGSPASLSQDRMFREMEARLMDPPSFVVTPSSVTVTLRNCDTF